MALDLEHFNADPWDLNDIVPNDIEVICFRHFLPFLYFFSYFVHHAEVRGCPFKTSAMLRGVGVKK